MSAAWLMELASSSPACPLYVAETDGRILWTSDHGKAHRFPTKRAAVRFAGQHLSGDFRFAEHSWWCEPPAALDDEDADEADA